MFGLELIWMNTLQIIFYYIKGYTSDFVKLYTHLNFPLFVFIYKENEYHAVMKHTLNQQLRPIRNIFTEFTGQ